MPNHNHNPTGRTPWGLMVVHPDLQTRSDPGAGSSNHAHLLVIRDRLHAAQPPVCPGTQPGFSLPSPLHWFLNVPTVVETTCLI
jgi:hypothetical protein